VVPDGVDPALFLNLSPLALSIFKDFNLFNEDFVFFYPTRIVRRKNIELAIRITKAINVEGKKVSLIITSPPDPHNEDSLRYYQSLKNLAEELGVGDKVIFLYEYKDEQGKGIRVDDQLLRDLYLLSDLLLFPTSSEGFGIPILEAGICNLPVACSRIEPLTEIGSTLMIVRKRWPGTSSTIWLSILLYRSSRKSFATTLGPPSSPGK